MTPVSSTGATPGPPTVARIWGGTLVSGSALLLLGGWLLLQPSAATLLSGMGTSFVLLLATVFLSATTAILLASLPFRRMPGTAKAARLVAQMIAFFPVAALSWSFIGLWLGQLHYPVESFLPSEGLRQSLPWLDGLALEIWYWAPVIMLTSVPLTAALFTTLLAKRKLTPVRLLTFHLPEAGSSISVATQRQRCVHKLLWLGMLSLLQLAAVESLLAIPGWGGQMATALTQQQDGVGMTRLVIAGVCLALAWRVVWGLLWKRGPNSIKSPPVTPRDAAVVLGHSQAEAWRRHEASNTIRRTLSALFGMTAWLIVVVVLLTFFLQLWPGILIQQVGMEALRHPAAPLLVGALIMLCPLFFWMLGRILPPRLHLRIDSHGKR